MARAPLDPIRPADWTDGVRSIAVGIAGNRSLETGLPMQVADLGVAILRDSTPRNPTPGDTR